MSTRRRQQVLRAVSRVLERQSSRLDGFVPEHAGRERQRFAQRCAWKLVLAE